MNTSRSSYLRPDSAEPGALFARRVTSRLDAGSQSLPHDISERLRVARAQAVAQRKVPVLAPATGVVAVSGGAAALRGPDITGFWTRFASAIPLVALVGGLVAINVIQADQRASELAEVDAALLTDDLPPAAYTDPGFAQYLQNGTELGQ